MSGPKSLNIGSLYDGSECLRHHDIGVHFRLSSPDLTLSPPDLVANPPDLPASPPYLTPRNMDNGASRLTPAAWTARKATADVWS